MTEPQLLHADIVLFLHDRGVREFGGLHGVRDDGLLRSALARAEEKLAHAAPGEIDVRALAAAYAFGIARNHPFNDGNNCTAWAACALSLRLNGAGIAAPAMEIIETVVALAAGQIDEDRFVRWLRERQHAAN